jgi:hypothetical protein
MLLHSHSSQTERSFPQKIYYDDTPGDEYGV